MVRASNVAAIDGDEHDDPANAPPVKFRLSRAIPQTREDSSLLDGALGFVWELWQQHGTALAVYPSKTMAAIPQGAVPAYTDALAIVLQHLPRRPQQDGESFIKSNYTHGPWTTQV
jgi:hypothetical protein